MTLNWNNLDILPEDEKEVWVLNEEYGSTENDPLCQRSGLMIRNAIFHRANGWRFIKCKEFARVKYWCEKTSDNEMPKTWGKLDDSR